MTVLPDRVRFIAMPAPGGPEVLRLAEGRMPRPAAGEGLIRIAAAG
jgi:NADPH2:quinone reductase